MAQENPNRLVEWLQLLRGHVPVIRQRFEGWVSAIREEPMLIWQTAVVRYTVYGLGVVVLLWGVSTIAGSLVPSPPANARPEATKADFHIVCSNPDCGYHFVIHREFGFRKFPVVCPKCGKSTGEQARRCNSETCRGRWVVPKKVDDELCCPICGARFE